MDRIQNLKHSKETFYYGLSVLFERASYYGLRAAVILYMTGEVLRMNRDEAFTIFGWFTASLIITKIIGAVLGDLLIGNRKTIIIGGIVQSIGAFILCFPTIAGLYTGLFLVILGTGFYSPNMSSNFGKLYLEKTKLLDSGFTIFYLLINLGSFLGILLIGYLGEKHGDSLGFITAGVLMLLSLIPIIIVKDKIVKKPLSNDLSINKRVVYIAIAILSVGFFWSIYEISSIRVLDLQRKLREISLLGVPKSMWPAISSGFFLPISLIGIVLWSYFYSTQFFKLMLGFIFGVIAFGILFLIPEVPAQQHTFIYFLSLFFLGISEVYIAPIVHSILTQYSNPKYLAILISLAFIPTRLISLIFGLFNDRFYDNPTLALKFAIIAMTISSITLIGYVLWNKRTTHNNIP